MRWGLLAVALLSASAPVTGDSAPATRVGTAAPTWDGVRWISNAPAAGLAPASYRGRVLLVVLFEGEHDTGLAALAEARKRLAPGDDVALVALQWLGWRGAEVGTPEAGAKRLRDHGLDVPHGVLLGERERIHLAPFGRYAASSLPWTQVVDRAGVVRCEGPLRDAARLVSWIETLRAVPGSAHSLVGQRIGSTAALRGLPTADGATAFAGRPLTLLRWWTNGCPHCTGSVPSLARLERRLGARGLGLVAVYHPKGRPLSDDAARATAAGMGVSGPVVFDDRWTKYMELRERGGLNTATSISVLVDAEGVIRWVHPGPRLQDFGDPRRDGTEAFAELERLVDCVLPPAPPPPAAAPRPPSR